MEKIIEIKKCKHCGVKFEITDKDLEFYDKISPVFNTEKFQIPSSSLCPECRQKRRLIWRKERGLFKRTCDATGKEIISMYSPDKNDIKVYSEDVWWSYKWNALEYGIDFDFNRGFSEQFNELMGKVPFLPRIAINNENSDYTHLSSYNKDCYLLFNGSYNEELIYSYWVQNNKKSFDLYGTTKSQNCYENIDSKGNFKCFYTINSINCKNSLFIRNCINCEECIFCSNLNGKKYYINNKKLSEKEYLLEKEKIFSNFKENIKIFFSKKNGINKYSQKENVENCIGDYIEDSKNCVNCFDIKKSENCKYCYNIFELKNSMDVTFFGYPSEFLYESNNVGLNSFNVIFSSYLYNCSNIIYSYNCHNSSNLFGCIGLKNKKYCIFNKQYTKEEYNKLVPQIIEKMQQDGEWGEFFPSSISPFGYNETVAQEYFPLKKEEALEKGFKYSNYESPKPNVEKIIPANKLPENISEIPDDILNWAIECEVTKKPFRIIKPELEFYRKYNLPIPRKHPDQRHLERMKLRNPRKLFDRKCDKCGIEMKTTYSPDRPEKVYCDKCYNKEVY